MRLSQTVRTSRLCECLAAVVMCFFVAGCERETEVYAPQYDFLTPCERPDRVAATAVVAESLCGSIEVYEDRAAASGRKINLNIMVIPAFDRLPKADPIFFLAGGPGQAATEMGPFVAMRLTRLRQERDIVLVDQRGTGRSNALDCEADDDALEDLSISMEELLNEQLQLVRDCLASLDADPALYTTPIAMDDLNQVRQHLGFEQINLFGISYGTRAALVYMRRHGESVRSALLDGVAPLTMVIPRNVAVDANLAFENVLRDCASSTTCAAAFPDLKQEFVTLLDSLEPPPAFTFTHPRTGEQEQGVLHKLMVTRILRGVLYDRTLSSLVPFAIHRAAAGDYQPLVTLGLSFYGEESSMSVGMTASVLCAEDMNLVSDAGDADTWFDNEIYRQLAPICEFWPKGDIPDNYFDAVESDTPVLLTSGKLDPITPPAYAIEAMRTLSNSEHVIVPGVGHGAVFDGCMPGVVKDFFDTADPRGLDSACASDLRRPPFFTRYTGVYNPRADDAPVEEPGA